MELKAILIDDEILALELIKQQLSEFNNIKVVETFNTFDIETNQEILKEIHVVFLDIEMPGINGLNLAELMLEINPDLLIVFVTAYNEYAVQAFELYALDYLLKPIEQDRLEKTIERIYDQLASAAQDDYLLQSDTLYINLCQELKISTEDHHDQTENIRWRTQKTQELFIYLLYHAGETVPKAKLAELFWPDQDLEKAFSQLYTAIYNIRKTLAPYKEHLTIESVHEGYTLLGSNIKIDIVEWEREVKNLPDLNSSTLNEYESVMDLYTGPFLDVYDYIWAETERFRLGMLWVDYAKRIADYYKYEGEIERAIIWYEKICDYRPEDEHANLSIMQLHASLGYGILVDHQYNQYKREIAELEIPVDSNIEKWYSEYKSR